MTRFSTLLKRATAAMLLGSLMLLAGCHFGGTKEVTTASMAGQFDATIQPTRKASSWWMAPCFRRSTRVAISLT